MGLATADARLTGIPWLVVEVLSSHRGDDLVVKATKYAHHGLRDFWVLDPANHHVRTYQLVDDTYVATGEHTHGRTVLRFADTDVDIDIDALLG